MLEDSSCVCVGRPLGGQPFDYRPIVEGYLHKPKHNQTKAEHMAAFYTIFIFVFSDKTLSKEEFLLCLDYEECFVFLGLKYKTMLTLIELTEILEMALLRSNRIPERVKGGYLFVSKVLNGSAPRFLVLQKVDNFWDHINLTKRQKKKFSELPQYVLQFSTRMSSHLIKLNEYKEFYKGFKGKALYMLFMLDFFGVLLALTFEKEHFTYNCCKG